MLGLSCGRSVRRVGRTPTTGSADQLPHRYELEIDDRFRTDPAVRIEDGRLVISGQSPKCLAIQHPSLAEGLDRCRPGAAVVAVAVLDLHGHARGTRAGGPDAWSGQDGEPAQGLHPGLADD